MMQEKFKRGELSRITEISESWITIAVKYAPHTKYGGPYLYFDPRSKEKKAEPSRFQAIDFESV
jgi:hypothetical protein